MLDYGFYNMDCMDGMKDFPDKFFDLAVVDPPYGDAINKSGGVWNRFGQRFDRYKTLHLREPEEIQKLRGQEAHGRENTQKNYYVGCGPETRIF